MFGDVFLLEKDGKPAVRAQRLAFGDTSGRNEAWLRDTLFDNPELLPIQDIDPSFGPIIPLCREMRTEAGPLDVAFINPFGRLTLVECKLWRNPEARRKVVAQVLDYARAITTWTYSDLQRRVAAALGRTGNIPYELAKAHVPNLVEQDFVDQTTMAMRSGRFLLLIAGDGIREDVGALAELINRNAAAGFSFGLVEVALYGFEDGSVAVQPRAIAKTKIIERTVVVLGNQSQDTGVLVEEGIEKASLLDTQSLDAVSNSLGESPKQAAYRAWWEPITAMAFADPDQEPPTLYYPNNVRTPLPWPKTWIGAYRSGESIGIATGGSGQSHKDLIDLLAHESAEILSELPEGSEFKPSSLNGVYTFTVSRSMQEFQDVNSCYTWIKETLNAFVNTLRPRVKMRS